MPIHIIRDVALTIRSFYKRINDFVKYRQATRDMNDRYPDATPEEVAREDVCIICREDMRAWAQAAPAQNPTNTNPQPTPPPTALDERTRPKKLPCGHILHFACLRSWLERQQNCPTCRRAVLAPNNPASASGPNAPNPNAGVTPAPNQQQAAPVPQQPGHGPVVHQNVFNLGPFRLAFGARIGRGVPPPINNNPAAPNRPQIPGDIQGFGNAFGFFGQNQAAQQQNNVRITPINVSAQLHQIEQQLMREINSLRAQSDQLYLVRNLQGELARLRIQQAQGNHGPLMNGAAITAPQRPLNVGVQGFQPIAVPSAGPNQPFSVAQAFTSGQQPQNMGPGHADLPPGMTLPEGWTVVPLQRLAPASGSAAELPTPSSSSQQHPSSQTPVISTETQAGTPSNVAAPTPTAQQSNAFAIPIPPSSMPLASTSPQLPSSNTSGPTTIPQAPATPSLSDIPHWGSAPLPPSNGLAENNRTSADLPPTSMNGNAEPPDANANADTSSEARREAKGKGKAVTIEDSTEDVD